MQCSPVRAPCAPQCSAPWRGGPAHLHHRVLPVLHQVSLVGEGEAARLPLLIVFCAAEPVLLLYAGGVVQVVQLPGVPSVDIAAGQVVRVADVVVREAANLGTANLNLNQTARKVTL